jgi:hypothetical protein
MKTWARKNQRILCRQFSDYTYYVAIFTKIDKKKFEVRREIEPGYKASYDCCDILPITPLTSLLFIRD